MSETDKSNVVKLHVKKAPSQSVAAEGLPLSASGPIIPKSILDMTEVEQETHLRSLRDRRLRAAAAIANAHAAKRQIANFSNSVKMEKKINAVQAQYDKVTAALTKLETMVLSMRTLQLQLTPTSQTHHDDNNHGA